MIKTYSKLSKIQHRLNYKKLLLVIAFIPFSLAHGQNTDNKVRWYQTSLILFRHLNSNQSTERWPTLQRHYIPWDAKILYTPEALRLSPNHQYQQQFIPISQWEMKKEAQAIRYSKNLRLIYHASWLTPISDDKPKITFNIQAGAKSGNHQQVEGSIAFVRTRYLHAKLDLWYNKINPAHSLVTLQQTNQLFTSPYPLNIVKYGRKPSLLASSKFLYNYPYTANFPLNTSERLNISKLNYFDSPVLGALIKMTYIDDDHPIKKYLNTEKSDDVHTQ